MPNRETLFVMVVLAVSPWCWAVMGEGINKVDGETAIDSILEGIRQSSAPSQTMRVKWTYETVDPVVLYFIKPGMKAHDEIPQQAREYVVTVSGIRSRIDSLKKAFKRKSEEPYSIQRCTAVFNGTQQRRLVERIKGEGRRLVGWQYLRDKNYDFFSNLDAELDNGTI